MNRINRYEIYKDVYYKELERKNQLEDSLMLPVGIVTALSTGLFYLVTNFNYKCNSYLKYIFIVLVIISLIFIIITIYQLIRAYNNFTFGYEYHYLSYSAEIEKYYSDLIDFFKSKKHSKEKTVIESNKIIEQFFIDEFITKSDFNCYNNDKKQSHSYKARVFLIFALITIFILVFPYGINYYKYKDNKMTVEINNPIKVIK